MRQLELPFTKRGRRDFRRLNNTNRRAFKCWHKGVSGTVEIIWACDNATARRAYQLKLQQAGTTRDFCLYVDIKAVRAPEHDGKEGEAKRISKRKPKKTS